MLVPVLQHSWNLMPAEAIALQRELAHETIQRDLGCPMRTVAGIDVGLQGDIAHAALVVLRLPELTVLEQVQATRMVAFPYVPGLLSFREAPVILDALERMREVPDVLMVDGQGYAHPRRLGIASHLGVLLDCPSVGCAKSLLCGQYEEPARERGSYTWLRERGEIIGAVVRTRAGIKPVFVSAGHKLGLESAITLVLGCGRGYRLPEPTRQAHQLASGWRSTRK